MPEALVVLLTIQEVAERLGKSTSMARWMLSKGDFSKTARIGGRIMVRESDLNAWIAAKFEGAV